MKIKRLSQFLNDLSKIKKDDSKQLFFRGHSNWQYSLHPSLYRKENYHLSEDKIFKDAVVNCPNDFSNCKTTLEILVKMQHYGVPTRILDLTKNALVALYFACEIESNNDKDKDGEVLLLNIPNKNVSYYDSDKITILSNLAKQDSDFGFQYDPTFDPQSEDDIKLINKQFGFLLHSIKEDKPHFYDIINPRHLENVYAVHVKLDNPRIIRQSGAFLVFGINKRKTLCAEIDPNWILETNNGKIKISSNAKQEILNELDILGINKSTLFPELDVQASFLKKKYNKESLIS